MSNLEMNESPVLVYSTDFVNVIQGEGRYYLLLEKHVDLSGIQPIKNNAFYSTSDWSEALKRAYEYENTNELLWLAQDTDIYIKWFEKQQNTEKRKIYVIGKSDFAKNLTKSLDNIEMSYHFMPTLDQNVLTDNAILIFCDNLSSNKNDLVKDVGHLKHISVLAKKTDKHFSKTSLFLISPPKAGTHLLFRLAEALGYRDGNWRDENDYQGGEWRYLRRHNAHTSAKSFFVDMVDEEFFGNRLHPFVYSPAIFMYRHVVDVLLSEAEYYHKPGATVFSGVMRALGSTTARMKYLLSDGSILGPFVKRLKEFSSWFDCPNVIPLSYEAILGNRGGASSALKLDTIWKIMLLIEVDGSVPKISSELYDRKSPTLNKAICFRSTEMDLSDAIGSEELQDLAKLNETFGYSADITEKKLSLKLFESKNFECEAKIVHQPILVLGNFFANNIVLYEGVYFAVPISKGAFTPDMLNEITLKSSSIEELKYYIFRNSTTGCNSLKG